MNISDISEKCLELLDKAIHTIDTNPETVPEFKTTSPMNTVFAFSRIFRSCHLSIRTLYEAGLGVESMIMLRPQLESMLCLFHFFDMKGDIDKMENFAKDYFDWACVKAKNNMDASYDKIPNDLRHIFYSNEERSYFLRQYDEVNGP